MVHIITWKKRFPKKEIITVYKKEHNGRTPTKGELDAIKLMKYFNSNEW
jgi:hypothetical protein